jgi:LPS-assembly protein
MKSSVEKLRHILLPQCLIALFFLTTTQALGQVESPDRLYLFQEDSRQETQLRNRAVKAITTIDRVRKEELDFSAPQVEYDQEENTVRTSGGITITRGALSAFADQAEISIDTENVALDGNVFLVTPEFSVSADAARVNIDSETGEFVHSEVVFEEGGYRLYSSLARKLSESEYSLLDCSVTTCYCPDKKTPWQLTGRRVDITQNEYAFIYDAKFLLYGVPLFYTPFFAFPVKEQRSTGLLPASYGYSGRDGIQLKLPFFWAIDDYSDILLSPFMETETRYGTFFDYRRIFSQRSQLDSRLLYSNERPRKGDLRGTRIDDVFDPSIDDDRYGGYLSHRWRAEPTENYTLSTITDLRYASDNLLVREIEDSRIGDPRSRYLTSRAILRSGYGPYLTGELVGEYNQALITDQDTTFQRVPELRLTALRSFRPFGANPYGFRLATRTNFSATSFVREDGYDGLRLDLNPVFRLPFHYRNYLASELELGLRQTNYFLNETALPSTETLVEDQLERTNDRSILNLGYTVSTALERVYEVDSGSWLAQATEFGPNKLRRVKHVLEPLIRYNYVPQTFQDDLPVFDSIDRIRERSLVTYELKSSLYGRFSPDLPGGQAIADLTPEIHDLPLLDTNFPLEDFGAERGLGVLRDRVTVDRGEIREIASFSVRQNYDYLLDRSDDSERSPWSDVAAALGLYPTRNFGLALDSTIDVEEQNFTSWGVSTHARNRRGDSARARFSYIENSLNQIEGNLQMILTNRIRLGYYGRYDELARSFLENRVGLRFVSGCNCWYLDAVYSDTTNPDRAKAMLTFTLRGIGDVTQSLRLEER